MKLKSKYERESFEEVIRKSINYLDVCRNLNMGTTYGNRKTIKRYIQIYDIDISHFYTPRPKNETPYRIKHLHNEILVENSTYNHTTNLKNRLYNLGLKQRECELCGQNEEWRGKKMSLIIDHINGVYNDNRLENLRIVCPNCNATLDTHCGKHIKKVKVPKKKYMCVCGNETKKENNVCIKCSQIKQRKVKDRPDLKILLNEIDILGYSKTGLKYGVSDNTIRNWIKQYNHVPPTKKGSLVK